MKLINILKNKRSAFNSGAFIFLLNLPTYLVFTIQHSFYDGNGSTDNEPYPIVRTLSSPILWYPSEKAPVAKKIIYKTINFTIPSLCNRFGKTNNDSERYDHGIWCRTLYRKLIVDEMIKNCKQVKNVKLFIPDDNVGEQFRYKRSLRSIPSTLTTVSLAGVVTTLGLKALQLFSDDKLEMRMDELEMDYLRNMDLIEKFSEKTFEVYNILSKELNHLENKLDNITEIILSSDNWITIPHLFQIDSYFKSFFRALQKGRISEHFNYLFPNLTLCDNCPQKFWNGYSCEIKTSDNNNGTNDMEPLNMILKLKMIQIDPNYQMLNIDPFIIMEMYENKEICLYKYEGHQYFLYDQINDCIKSIILNPSVSNVIFPQGNNLKCFNKSPSSMYWKNYFQKSYCKNASDLESEEIVQIKSDYNYNYVYCNGFTMQILPLPGQNHSKPFECGNIIYQLDRHISFKIGNRTVLATDIHQNVQNYLGSNIDGQLFLNNNSYASIILETNLNHARISFKTKLRDLTIESDHLLRKMNGRSFHIKMGVNVSPFLINLAILAFNTICLSLTCCICYNRYRCGKI